MHEDHDPPVLDDLDFDQRALDDDLALDQRLEMRHEHDDFDQRPEPWHRYPI